jgi:hypothetical protein
MYVKQAQKLIKKIPFEFHPNYVTSFLYDQNGRLNAHVDKIDGWIILFSLGCCCKFWVQGKEMEQRKGFTQLFIKNLNKDIVFQSGDVLMFNGAAEAEVLHGIDEIILETCPNYLPKLKDLRVSLQFRSLHYVPKKVKNKLLN